MKGVNDHEEDYAPLEFRDKPNHWSIRLNVPKWAKHLILHLLNTTCSFLLYVYVLQPYLEKTPEPQVLTEDASVCTPEAEAQEEPPKEPSKGMRFLKWVSTP